MIAQVLALACQQGGIEAEDGLLSSLCEVAITELEGRLRPGLGKEDCGFAFIMASALLALGYYEKSQASHAVTGYQVGDVSVTRGQVGEVYREQVKDLLRPYVEKADFAFRSVEG